MYWKEEGIFCKGAAEFTTWPTKVCTVKNDNHFETTEKKIKEHNNLRFCQHLKLFTLVWPSPPGTFHILIEKFPYIPYYRFYYKAIKQNSDKLIVKF